MLQSQNRIEIGYRGRSSNDIVDTKGSCWLLPLEVKVTGKNDAVLVPTATPRLLTTTEVNNKRTRS